MSWRWRRIRRGSAQCARFLREQLPGARLVAASSTAEAVRSAVAASEADAAIAPARAADLHGGVVLRERVEDDPDNATRFVVLARGNEPVGEGAGPFKTSVLFAGAGDSSPGWLVRCLSEFAFRGVNLTKIESRPRRRQLGALPVPRRSRGRRARRAPPPRRSKDCASIARRFACSGPTRPRRTCR